MKTVKYVIDAVYALIPSEHTAYKYSHPDKDLPDTFIVVNTLGVPKDPLQTVEINVNCYTKDLSQQLGIPDLVTMDEMARGVIDDLHDYNNDEFDIEFVNMNIFRDTSLNSHYANLRFQLIFINN